MKRNIRLLYLLYGLSIIIIIITSSFFYNKFSALNEYSNRVEKTSTLINHIETLKLELVKAENNQLDYLVRKNDSLLEPQALVIQRLQNIMDTIQGKMDRSEQQYRTFIKLKSAISERFFSMAEVWEKAKTSEDINYERFYIRGQKAMNDFWQLANKMEILERQALKESLVQKQHYADVAPIYLYIIFGLTCIFQVVSFFYILKESKTRFNYQHQLEQKVKDLAVTNAELEQIAFVASHDLQEPLRKIQTFSDRLLKKHGGSLDDDGKQLLERMNVASKRVQGLMADLVNYTTILHADVEEKPVSLDECLDEALATLKPLISKVNAIINKESLPEIKGQQKQLNLLFYNLLENALKFRKQETYTIINISCSLVTEEENAEEHLSSKTTFYRVSISDNGIGFNEDFAHKIFFIFQRLHTQNSKYTGKGIGLAISKRIMMNHNGFITASGEPGVGATFHLFFPYNNGSRIK